MPYLSEFQTYLTKVGLAGTSFGEYSFSSNNIDYGFLENGYSVFLINHVYSSMDDGSSYTWDYKIYSPGFVLTEINLSDCCRMNRGVILSDADNGFITAVYAKTSGIYQVKYSLSGALLSSVQVINGPLDISDSNQVPLNDEVLKQNYPNPFNPETTIKFTIPHTTHAKLAIFNIKGQLVKQAEMKNLSEGQHSYVWDGKNDLGHPVTGGIYFYQLSFDKEKYTKKMILIK